jgi:hypothetical protein
MVDIYRRDRKVNSMMYLKGTCVSFYDYSLPLVFFFIFFLLTYLLGYLSRGRYCGRKFQVVHLMIASSFSLSLSRKKKNPRTFFLSTTPPPFLFHLCEKKKKQERKVHSTIFFFLPRIRKIRFHDQVVKIFSQLSSRSNLFTCVKVDGVMSLHYKQDEEWPRFF